jgi:hypothetical protein
VSGIKDVLGKGGFGIVVSYVSDVLSLAPRQSAVQSTFRWLFHSPPVVGFGYFRSVCLADSYS